MNNIPLNIINGINGISFKLEPYLREGVQQ
jgi:hypothetical protein